MKHTLPPLAWIYFHKRIRSISDLSEELIADGELALSFLEKELGAGFFNTCGKNHPISHKIMMVSQVGQLKELIRWVRVLRKLKSGDSNYPYLLKKLHSAKVASSEGIPFLDFSARHLDHGFAVYFPKEIQGQKNPDIELTFANQGEKINVEVTRISEGGVQKQQELLYQKLLHVCLWHGYNLPNAGKLYKLVPDAQLPQLINRIKILKKEAAEKKKLAAYRDEYLSIAFAHQDALKELDEWCGALKLERRFDGFNVEYDYTTRMIKNSRLKKEAKQLPDGKPGLIYCPVHVLFPLTMNVPQTVAAFVKELGKYQHIFGLVFYGEVLPPLGDPFLVDDPLFTYAMLRNQAHVGRYTLMIKNPYFTLELSELARTALVSAAI